MKKVNFIYKIFSLLVAVIYLNACNKIADIEKVKENLELSTSSTDIALDEFNMAGNILTFSWTEARTLSDDYIISYETKLDVEGNNFGSSTAILTYEDQGVFSKSFTSEQIQNWANQKWKLPVNKPFTLEFRVTVQWEGGPAFQAPEVRTVKVNVQPVQTIVFQADKIFLKGSAITGLNGVQMGKTLENESKYAYLVDLVPGELQIPVEFEGQTNYICPADLEGTLQDGLPETVKMRENPVSWNIKTAGKYRIIVDMTKTTVTIYSPVTDLKPAVVEWILSGVTQTTTVNDLWEYGVPTGWTWRGGNWKQSLADPQIFVYTGPALSGRTKFGVSPVNQAYVYTGNKTATDTPVTLGTACSLFGGYSTNERNAYFALPSGTNSIVLDLRNMTMLANKK